MCNIFVPDHPYDLRAMHSKFHPREQADEEVAK